MSKINIKFEGFDKLQDKVETIARRMDIAGIIGKAAEVLVIRTRSSLPGGAKRLAYGVKYSYNREKAEGKVHIMGDWRLRFFEKGTQFRKTKSGAGRGRMAAHWYFRDAVKQSKQDVIETYKKSFMEELHRLWDK